MDLPNTSNLWETPLGSETFIQCGYFFHIFLILYIFLGWVINVFVWNRVLGLIILGQIYAGYLLWFQAMLKLNEICSVWVFWLREIPVEKFVFKMFVSTMKDNIVFILKNKSCWFYWFINISLYTRCNNVMILIWKVLILKDYCSYIFPFQKFKIILKFNINSFIDFYWIWNLI